VADDGDEDNMKRWIEQMEEDFSEGKVEEIKREAERDRQMEGQGLEGGKEGFDVESREFKQYQEEVRSARKKNWYERLVSRTAIFRKEFPDLKKEHTDSLRLLDWDIEPDQIVPAATIVTILLVPATFALLLLPLPMIFRFFFLVLPIIAFFYLVKYPKLKAQQKLVESSEGLVLSILYMVVYMRHSPNLEGAVSFAARRLNGPISNDLKEIIWELDVRKYDSIGQGLENYMRRWKPYNKGFVESLSLLKSSINSPTNEKRLEVLNKSVDTLLESTRAQMNSFARDLKMPIMVLHGLGILLPILGIILFPLVANFMGGDNMGIYLAFLYNVLLPLIVFALLRTLMTQRPMSFSSAAGAIGEGRATLDFEVAGRQFEVSMFVISVPLFLLMVIWPGIHYYNIVFGPATWPVDPGVGVIFREAFIILAFTIPTGIHLLYGYGDNIELQEKTEDIEAEFPKALFELGNALDKGKPIERAVDDAAEGSRELSISEMFNDISYNIKQYGDTFHDAVFHEERGAINKYPSQLISTIMEIVSEATSKGTQTASASILSISDYLVNIQETQEKLEELMGDTLQSVKFLGYILAPVISGIAVGMGATISTAFYTIGQVFSGAQQNVSSPGGAPGSAPGGGLGGGSAGLLSLFQVDSSIPPGVLQLVVGIYIIQISYLISTLMVRLQEGDNPIKLKVAVGKIFIVSSVFYVIVVVVIVAVFGSIIAGVGEQVG